MSKNLKSINTENGRYDEARKALEGTRKESRQARLELIGAIIGGGKDVLSVSDIQGIKTALAKFLDIQKRVSRAFHDEAEASAVLINGVVGDWLEAPSNSVI